MSKREHIDIIQEIEEIINRIISYINVQIKGIICQN